MVGSSKRDGMADGGKAANSNVGGVVEGSMVGIMVVDEGGMLVDEGGMVVDEDGMVAWLLTTLLAAPSILIARPVLWSVSP